MAIDDLSPSVLEKKRIPSDFFQSGLTVIGFETSTAPHYI